MTNGNTETGHITKNNIALNIQLIIESAFSSRCRKADPNESSMYDIGNIVNIFGGNKPEDFTGRPYGVITGHYQAGELANGQKARQQINEECANKPQ